MQSNRKLAPGSLPADPRERKIALCRAALALRMRGDIEQALGYFTEDARFDMVGNNAFNPYSGSISGRAGIAEKLRMIHVAFEYSGLDPYLFVVDGDHLMARFRGLVRNRGTGPSASIEGIAHITFQGDLISYFGIFLDTAAVARLSQFE